MTTTTSVSADIEDRFCQGQPFDVIVAAGDWSRDDVLAVLREHAWDLDPSGRLPRSKRITSPRGLRRAGVEASAAAAAAVAKPVRREPVPTHLRDELPPAIVEPPRGHLGSIPETRPPAPSPRPAQQPSADVYEAIAEWADDDETTVQDEPPVEAPTPKATVAVIGPEADAAVARFLAERTVPAGDDQFITGPELRDSYEDWSGLAGAPVLSVRQFGAALTARYRKKQSSTRNADGVKPMRYYGLAWKPMEAPLETAEPEAHAEPVASAPDDELLADWEIELLKEKGGRALEIAAEASDPVEKTDTPPLNLLAVGLDHSDRRVRAAARAVERAVDVLCAALSRVSA